METSISTPPDHDRSGTHWHIISVPARSCTSGALLNVCRERRGTIEAKSRNTKSSLKSKRPGIAMQSRAFFLKNRRRPTLPHSLPCSTIGAEELNFRVRNGNGWNLFAMTTEKMFFKLSSSTPSAHDQPAWHTRLYSQSGCLCTSSALLNSSCRDNDCRFISK
jgi:hypothetical protein